MRSTITQIAAIGFSFFALAAQVGVADDRLNAPAMGESSSPDEHLATSSDPDSHLAQSEDLDDHEGQSKDLDDLVVESEDLDDLVVESEDLDDHMGYSKDLQDLPSAEDQQLQIERETLQAMRERYREEVRDEEAAEPPGDDASSPGNNRMNMQIAAIHEAKQALEISRKLANEADDVYANMMRNDYPRGEARLKIVDERNIARDALRAAEQRYDAALDGGGGPASY